MSAIDLDAITARNAAATEGPWHVDEIPKTGESRVIAITEDGDVIPITAGGSTVEEAAFIAHARQDVALLVGELRRYQAITLDDLAAAFAGSGRFPMVWDSLTRLEKVWMRDRVRPIFELLRGPAAEPSADELATITRFGLDRPQGPVEFDFTPGGGDAA